MHSCPRAHNAIPVSCTAIHSFLSLVLESFPIQPLKYLKGKTAKQEQLCEGKGPFFPLQYSPKDGSGAHDHSVRAGVDSHHLLKQKLRLWLITPFTKLSIDFQLSEEQVQYEFTEMFLTVELRGAES